jgi:uncharacterized membrane protein (DUF106 family)
MDLVPPLSTIVILIIATVLGTCTSAVNRRFIDVEQLKLFNRESREYFQELREATRTNDKNLKAKLKRREIRMNQLRAVVFKQQFKAMGVTIVPIFLIYALLAGFPPLGVKGIFTGVAAYLPFGFSLLGNVTGNGITQMPFVWWYFLCSLAVNLPITRIFGISPSLED